MVWKWLLVVALCLLVCASETDNFKAWATKNGVTWYKIDIKEIKAEKQRGVFAVEDIQVNSKY